MSDITEVNVETGEIIERKMTKDEITIFNEIKTQNELLAEKISAQELAKNSAISKLNALGLTEEEIAAFRG